MGKGKGNNLRKCILIKKNQPLLITSGVHLMYLFKFKKLIEKKLNFRCSIKTNFLDISTSGLLDKKQLLKSPQKLKF